MRYLIVCLFVIAACQSKKNTQEEKAQPAADTTVKADTTSTNSPLSSRELTTSTGKIVVVRETHPMGMSMSDVAVFFKDDSSTVLSLKDKDPVSDVVLADLDKNGFDEVYVITAAAGSGSYAGVHGFYSNKDLSFSFVHMPDITEKDLAAGGMYEGYEGHDKIKIEGDKLVRNFPVKSDKNPSRSIAYTIKKTEGGFVFSPAK